MNNLFGIVTDVLIGVGICAYAFYGQTLSAFEFAVLIIGVLALLKMDFGFAMVGVQTVDVPNMDADEAVDLVMKESQKRERDVTVDPIAGSFTLKKIFSDPAHEKYVAEQIGIGIPEKDDQVSAAFPSKPGYRWDPNLTMFVRVKGAAQTETRVKRKYKKRRSRR